MNERSDPVERVIAKALDAAGIAYVGENDPSNQPRLDFYLPDLGIYIEAKRMASERTVEELARAVLVILIQGMRAAEALADLISNAPKTLTR